MEEKRTNKRCFYLPFANKMVFFKTKKFEEKKIRRKRKNRKYRQLKDAEFNLAEA